MGTHPIFESDFDCLTEKFQSEPMSTSLLRFTKIYGVGRNRTFSQSASTLGPKGKKPKKAGKGGGKSATVEPLKAETDTKKLQEFCCGLNIWSEKAADIFNIKEEDKENFLSDPKIRKRRISRLVMGSGTTYRYKYT